MSKTKDKPYHKAPRQFRSWTKADDNTLRSMVIGGKNSEQIATELGRTRAAVMGRKSWLGIKQKMTAARGSSMPYTGFGKEERSIKPTLTPTPVAVLERPKTAKPEVKSLGSGIDQIIAQSKSMGLKITISISSDDSI